MKKKQNLKYKTAGSNKWVTSVYSTKKWFCMFIQHTVLLPLPNFRNATIV